MVVCNTTGYYSILKHDNYIAIIGDNLILMDIEGKQIAKRDDLINIHKAIFLSTDLLLIDCGSSRAYIAISLKNGSTCWQINYPSKIDYTSTRFAMSQDCSNVFDYYEYKMHTYLIRIDLATRRLIATVLKDGLYCTSDLICDSEGNPCLLQHHFEKNDEPSYSLNGIRCESYAAIKNKYLTKWNHQWQLPFPCISKFFLGSSEAVLTKDLYVYQPEKNESYHLLENDPSWKQLQKSPIGCFLDESNQYITLVYDTVNVIVDWASRKIIAQYATPFGFGCLVNNEFWVWLDEGVVRKPFPLIEAIPKQKNVFWKPY